MPGQAIPALYAHDYPFYTSQPPKENRRVAFSTSQPRQRRGGIVYPLYISTIADYVVAHPRRLICRDSSQETLKRSVDSSVH
jgi:hypothetical protein